MSQLIPLFPRVLFFRAAAACLAAGAAQAHFAQLQPPSALSSENGGKGAPPCGEGTDSNVVTAVQGGHAVAIRLNEFVFHPGHYRFALSVNSRAELPRDPDVAQDSFGISISAAIQNPVKVPVLADDVFAHTSPPTADLQTSLTLPNLNCDKCTLQIIEFMAEHGANDGGGFFYHHCADLHITADPILPAADAAWPRAASQTSAVFPHIAAGGGWTTVLTFVNTSSAPVQATIAFRGDDGSPLGLPLATTLGGVRAISTTASLTATLDPNATLVMSAGEQASSTMGGWAEVSSAGSLSGYAIFRSASATGPPLETAVPLQSAASSAVLLPFDNTSGYVTDVALANVSSASAGVTATIWDDSGNKLGTQTITVAARGHAAFDLPSQLPLTTGKRGVVRFQAPASGGIAALALRFSVAGGFIWLPPM